MGQISLLTEGGARSSHRFTRARHGPIIPAYQRQCKELPQVHQSTAWANYPCLPKAVQGAPSGPPEHGMGQLSLLTEGGARSSLRSTRARHGPTIPAYRGRGKELPPVPPEHGMGQLSLLTEGGARSSLRSTRARYGATIPAYRGRCKELLQVHQLVCRLLLGEHTQQLGCSLQGKQHDEWSQPKSREDLKSINEQVNISTKLWQ
jgi:hypothetical protein